MNRRFESLRKELNRAIASDDVSVKTWALEMVETPGLLDRFNDDERRVLEALVSDIFKTRFRIEAELARGYDFENLREELTRAVLSNDVDEKTRALEEGETAGYFDGLTELEVISLKTIRSDIWRTRLEVYAEQLRASKHTLVGDQPPGDSDEEGD